MTQAGKILGEVLGEVLGSVRSGVMEIELDKLAEELIIKKGGKPGFKKVPGYNHTICVSTNNIVVHGIPGKRILKDGDIIGIDCGVYLEGFHTDMAETVRVGGKRNDEIDHFLSVGKKAVFEAISQAKLGNRVGHISEQMQKGVEGAGYTIVHNLVGHGVGKELHEDPEIPGYLARPIRKTPLLKKEQTIAIEVIYNKGKRNVVRTDDWTIASEDGSLSGLFERTLLVGEEFPYILTILPSDLKDSVFAPFHHMR